MLGVLMAPEISLLPSFPSVISECSKGICVCVCVCVCIIIYTSLTNVISGYS